MLPKDWKTVELKDLLSKSDLKQVKKFIENNDWNGLRNFLNEEKKKKELEEKGVLSDYLYYFLLSQKEKIRRLM